MTNNALKTAICSVFCALVMSWPSQAQIEINSLDPAARFDVGVLENGRGSLGPDLWSGTSSEIAKSYILEIPANASPLARELRRSVLLSGGTPPAADTEIALGFYEQARLEKILELENLQIFDEIATRSTIFTRSKDGLQLRAKRALLSASSQEVCTLTQSLDPEERTLPFWAKVRAYCHLVNDEIPAMELTADLLRRSGHKDPGFFALLGLLSGSRTKPVNASQIKAPIHIALAARLDDTGLIKGPLPKRLAAIKALKTDLLPQDRFEYFVRGTRYLTPEQMQSVLGSLSDSAIGVPQALNIDKPWDESQWGGAFKGLKESGNIETSAQFLGLLLAQSEKRGIFGAILPLFASELSMIPASYKAQFHPSVFAKAAVLNRDIDTLRNLHQALEPDDPLRARIALASDALGNGFLLSPLGLDIETRLTADESQDHSRAIRDTYLAVALGAQLPEAAYNSLKSVAKLKGKGAHPADMLALQAAAKRGAKAQTMLIAAQILQSQTTSNTRIDTLARIVQTLADTGLTKQAGFVAAWDFIGLDRE